jgi:TetR/AcrR family transcriptional regulator, ethionamide resistance regulator
MTRAKTILDIRVALPPVSASRTLASRPRKRGRRPKTHAAVLEATTQLLETTPLSELSVAQILAAAQVGRTSFYEHFSSKEDVVVKLVRGITAEVAEGLEPMFDRGGRPVEEAFREGLGNWMRISTRYKPLLVAAIEEWPTVPALRRLWFRTIDAMGAKLTTLIDTERAAGVAPPGAPSDALGATLAWGAERAFHVAMTGHHPTLTDESALVEPLLQLYIGTIYGQPLHRQCGSEAG